MSVNESPSLGSAYDLSIASLESLSHEANAIDVKLIATFASSSIIIGLLPIIQGEIVLTRWYWPELFLYLGLGAFIWVGFWIYQGLRLRPFYLLSPKALRKYYWGLEEEDFMKHIYRYLEETFEEESRHLSSKSFALILSIPGLAAEILFVVVWTFTRTGFPTS